MKFNTPLALILMFILCFTALTMDAVAEEKVEVSPEAQCELVVMKVYLPVIQMIFEVSNYSGYQKRYGPTSASHKEFRMAGADLLIELCNTGRADVVYDVVESTMIIAHDLRSQRKVSAL